MKIDSKLTNTAKSFIFCASLLALGTSASVAATAADVDRLFDELIAFEQSGLAQVEACNNAMVDISSGTFNQQAFAKAKEICITQAGQTSYTRFWVKTQIGGKNVGFKRRNLPISIIRKAINECNIDVIGTRLTDVIEIYRLLYDFSHYVAKTRLEIIGKTVDRLPSNGSVINPVNISDEEEHEIKQFLKATGLVNLSNDTGRTIQIVHKIGLEYKAGARYIYGRNILNATYKAYGRKRARLFGQEKDTWTNRLTKPDCPPLKIVDRSPPPKEKLKRKPVTTYGGVRKPLSNGQNIVAERPKPAPRKPENSPDITIQPINDLDSITLEGRQRFITEFDVGGIFPTNDTTLGQTQKTERDAGIGGSLSVYVPISGNGVWTVMPGVQIFGGRTDNKRLINQAPFPSSPFGGHTTYYGAAALLKRVAFILPHILLL